MKRFSFLFLIITLIALFAWAWTSRIHQSFGKSFRDSAQTIIPAVHNDRQNNINDSPDNISYDESRIQPLIPLKNDETFLQATAADLDNDGMPDQICAVKRQADQTITLIPGLQNPITGEYSRLEPIQTGVTQARTLLVYTQDIIGDRRQAIVYSGMNAENMQVLAVYLPGRNSAGQLIYTAIANLRSDGHITIQDVPRSDAYDLGLTGGDSFPIHTWSSDPESPQTLNQIERIYKWNRNINRYEQVSETKIEGKKIESRLISQLQGGNIDSFEQFLDGLWYVPTSSRSGEENFLFFNSKEKEITFHNGSTEEIFFRESGAPRRYGIYLTTRNRSISSIRRLIDIELTGIDEIKIKVQEDVKLKIGVASVWDGTYRKMSSATSASETTGAEAPTQKLHKTITSHTGKWTSSDGQVFKINGDSYTFTRANGKSERGQYAVLTILNSPILQLRSSENKTTSFFRTELIEGRGKEKDQISLILTEVNIGIGSISRTGSASIELISQP